eukprot:g3164.t1
MNAGPAGFTNAPVLKALCLTTTGSSVLWQAMQQNFVKPISPVLKPFVRAFVFKKTGELIFGVALLYYFRILERQTGSRKFGAYAVVVSTISFGLQSAIETAYKLKPLPSGPYGFIFASFLSLVFDIPPSQRLSFCGVPLSDKAFTYIMGLPLMFSNGTASMMAAACGVLAGFTYNSNLFNIRKFRFPVFVNLLLSNTVGRLLMGRSDRPIITMNSTRTTRHRQSQNTGQNSQSRGVVVSETAIQQLLSMGFEEDRVRTALQMTNNDIQSAIAMLVDRG